MIFSPFLMAALLGHFPGAEADLKAYVLKLNPEVAKAYKTKDSRFFDTLYSPEFKARDEHGVLMGRKEALFVVRFQLNTLNVLDYHTTVKAIKIEKARGTVEATSKMVGLTAARRGRPGEKVEITRRWSDIYEKRGGAWVLVFHNELAAPAIVSKAALIIPPKK
jgi:hypothetical protein